MSAQLAGWRATQEVASTAGATGSLQRRGMNYAFRSATNEKENTHTHTFLTPTKTSRETTRHIIFLFVDKITEEPGFTDM